ncbi:MAG TPA: lipopolysaccharide assembly protein LapA domain-containing protein [Microlunatus sp.]|nr:lipopolysaccharide assembly protein LapA domain-containing protein [Microlunatus sp.]
MTTEPSSSPAGDGPTETTTSEAGSSPSRRAPRVTRVSAAWAATGVALVLLILLIVFILQNSTKVNVRFLGMSGTIPLGMALLIAAVAGGVVVAIAGVARVTQLRMSARRIRQETSSP